MDMTHDPNDIKTTAFLAVFEEKLAKLIKRFKHERDKKARGEHTDLTKLKATVKEAKQLKKTVQKMRKKEGLDKPNEKSIQCPHCNGTIEL